MARALVVALGFSVALAGPSCNFTGNAASPVIVGGVGDSGTRGVRSLLELLGLRVCPATGKTGDDDGVQRVTRDILYGGIFPDTDRRFRRRAGKRASALEFGVGFGAARNMTSGVGAAAGRLGEPGPEPPGVMAAAPWHYSPDLGLRSGSPHMVDPLLDPYARYARAVVRHPRFDLPQQGRARLCAAVEASWKCAATRAAAVATPPSSASSASSAAQASGPANSAGPQPGQRVMWGFKEPRAAMFLKEWSELLGPGAKFLHVVRDGRDVALGDLRLLTSTLCAAYFDGYRVDSTKPHVLRQASETPVGKACAATGRNQLVAWALLNEAVADEGKRLFGPDRYLAVRIEDVALDPDPSPAIQTILDFLRGTGNTDQKSLSSRNDARPLPAAASAALASWSAQDGGGGGGSLLAPAWRFGGGKRETGPGREACVAAARVRGRHARSYGGAKHGDAARRSALLVRLGLGRGLFERGAPAEVGLLLTEEERGGAAPPVAGDGAEEGVQGAGGVGPRVVGGSSAASPDHAAARALRRFGYREGDWGLEKRAWTSINAGWREPVALGSCPAG